MQISPPDIEHYLLDSFQQGEEKGFNFLYNKYGEAIYFFAWKQTHNKEAAEDITADTFIKVWKHHAELVQHAKIKAYLFQAARNACIDYYKKQKLEQKRYHEIGYLSARDHEPEVLQNMIRTELIHKVYTALNELPPQCRKIFTGIFIEGKNNEEIARDMHIAVGTVRAQKVRGLQLLRKKLASFLLHIFF